MTLEKSIYAFVKYLLNSYHNNDAQSETLKPALKIRCIQRCSYFVVNLFFLIIYVGPLKNAIDWASRAPNCWADKPAAVVSAGGNFGGGRAQYHLRQVGVFLDLHFINKPELFVHAFQPPPKFDSDGNLIDPDTKERLKQVLLSLQAFTLRLQQ